jgi:amidase
MTDLVFRPAHELAQAIRERRVSSVELVEAYLAHIERHNPALNAIVTLDMAGVRQQALAADVALARGAPWGPLHGVPVTIEDIHSTAGLRTTLGHPAFTDHVPSEDSTVVARLKAAGAVILGKTNVSIYPDNPCGRTNNPWDIDRTPGTSSSGPAAAVAAGLTALDIGADTGGSILNPAHWCGVFGMRPTERRVPLTGLMLHKRAPARITRTMTVLGPMARSVADLRMVLQIIAGPDRGDPEVPPVPWRTSDQLDIRALRIAWMPALPGIPIAPDIRTAVEALASELAGLGVAIEPCLPEINLLEQLQLYGRLFALMVGAFPSDRSEQPAITLGDYFSALQQRDSFLAVWESFFDRWDAYLFPGGITTAPLWSSLDVPLVVEGLPVSEEEADSIYSLSPATGQPDVVIPVAKDRQGLPIGVQLIGRRWEDERLLAIAELLTEMRGGFQSPPGY